MNPWAATALATWVAMLGALYWLVKRRSRVNDSDEPVPVLPESFRGLSPRDRRQALDFAWTPGLRTMVTLPVRTVVQATTMGVVTATGVAAVMIATLLLVAFATLDDGDQSITSAAIFLIPVVALFGAALACFYSAVERRRALKKVRAEEAGAAARASRLKELAVALLRVEAQQWVEAMGETANGMALQEAGVVPEQSFTLLSCAISSPGRDGLPPARIGASYIFSNGSVIIVSGLVFDLKATSYSLIDANEPEFAMSAPDTWSSDEFFYKDIVEVRYAPDASTGESIKGREGELPREGTLTLGLVNGSRKEIPACRTDASGFVTLARERVRAVRT